MALFHRIRSLLRNVASCGAVERDLDDEVRAHLALLVDEKIQAGMPRERAEREARMELGGVEAVKEQVRDERAGRWLQSVLADCRFGLRQLRKNPGFTLVSTLALALGIGMSSIVFSVFYNGVLHPFPYRDSERMDVISVVSETDPNRGSAMFQLADLAALRAANHTMEDISGVAGWDVPYTKQGGSETIHGAVLTPNGMEFWGVAPLLGRGFAAEDAAPGAPPVILLGNHFWKREFNGDPSALGKTMILDNRPHTIIGVMPPRFFLYGADFYSTLAWDRPEPSLEDAMAFNLPFYFNTFGIRKKGASRDTENADLLVALKGNPTLHRDTLPDKFIVRTLGFNEEIVGDFSRTMYLLIGSVALLLFISSSNVASLLLVHTSSRAKEIALRSALGASRSRLVRQLFVESLLLGTLGCAAGVALAYAGLRLLVVVPGIQVPGEADLSLNGPVVVFAVLISFATTLLFGLSPAIFAAGHDLRTSMQGAGMNTGTSHRGSRIRAGLVVAQVALSLVLLVFAGLMIGSFLAITRTDPGIRLANLFFADIHLQGRTPTGPAQGHNYLAEVLERLGKVPGVLHATTAFAPPVLGGPMVDDLIVPGKPHEKKWPTRADAVDENFLATLGLPLVRGRNFSSSDVAGRRRVALVNQDFAARYFPGEDPIGYTFKLKVEDGAPGELKDVFFEIVGVFQDFRNAGIQDPPAPQLYIPYTVLPAGDRVLLARTTANAAALGPIARQIVSEANPNASILRPDTLESFLAGHEFLRPRFRVFSFSAVAGIGLGLSLIGLFGVMAYAVTLQTHEFGVRMALGALTGDILRLVLRRGLLLVGSGVVVGLCVSLFAVRIVKSQIWGISEFDPRVLILAPLAMLVAGVLACYVPARRATRTDPLVALRHE